MRVSVANGRMGRSRPLLSPLLGSSRRLTLPEPLAARGFIRGDLKPIADIQPSRFGEQSQLAIGPGDKSELVRPFTSCGLSPTGPSKRAFAAGVYRCAGGTDAVLSSSATRVGVPTEAPRPAHFFDERFKFGGGSWNSPK